MKGFSLKTIGIHIFMIHYVFSVSTLEHNNNL